MEIIMYLNEAIVASVPIDAEQISKPGYLSGHIRTLRERHATEIEQSSKEPQFLLHAASTRIEVSEEAIIQGKLFQ